MLRFYKKKLKREIVIIFIFISLNMCFWCFTHKAPPIICSRRQFQILPLFKNNNQARYFMRIVCQQTILMKYHTLFFSKIGEDVAAAVVIGTLRVKRTVLVSQHMFWVRNKKKEDIFKHSLHLCMLGDFSYITFRLLFSKHAFRNTIRGIQIRTDVLSVLVWIQTDCKGHLYISETTTVTASKERVKCPGRQTF